MAFIYVHSYYHNYSLIKDKLSHTHINYSCVLRYSEDECLSEQVRLYEEGQIEDREMTTMPGGIDIHNHEHLFRALFEKVGLFSITVVDQ